MSEPHQPAEKSAAVKSVAQDNVGAAGTSGQGAKNVFEQLPGEAFGIGKSVRRATKVIAHDRRRGDPIYRPLKIYTIDPAESKLVGNHAVVMVPYEPLQPGPVGSLFAVQDTRVDAAGNAVGYPPVDLDDPKLLIRSGVEPSATNPQFHQQMVYAVCSMIYATFRKALGRQLHWGFGETAQPPVRLRIRPHFSEEENACYNRDAQELQFGYFRARNTVGRNAPKSFVFTCLSHDIIAHEVTHALLDGLRPHFVVPSNPDVLALHEALGDLVAIFQHFTYESVVKSAMEKSGGKVDCAGLLTDVARQFGQTTDHEGPLRSAVHPSAKAESGAGDCATRPELYDSSLPPHELGSVLVSAIFEAFSSVYHRKVRDFIRLATGGTGVLPAGDMPVILLEFLAREASKIASHFLNICIRAVDYCPPMDVTFGDYLRAMITADFDLVPDDPWSYRDALIDAFGARRIFPGDAPTLTEDALLWREPQLRFSPIQELSFASLEFSGDPGQPSGAGELARQARALGRVATDPANMTEFGIAQPNDPRLDGDKVEQPWVESIRSSRRIGPDGQVVFDLVAEIAQRRWLRKESGGDLEMLGGSTVIIGPNGEVRYVIRKSITSKDRRAQLRDYATGAGGRYWSLDSEKRRIPISNLFAIVHANSQDHQPQPAKTFGQRNPGRRK